MHSPGCEAAPAHVLLADVMALKNPVAHASHWGWVVAEPTVLVNLPGGHLVWAVQESGLLLLDVESLKNPAGHTSHLFWAAALA